MTSEKVEPQEEDGGMGRLLRERLPRHPAPPVLRAAVVEALMPGRPRQPWWVLWLPPAFSAVATALIMLLYLAPSLPSTPGSDPVQLVTRAVLAEYARSVFWGENRSDVVPAALPQAMAESGIALSWVFTGDDDIRLINAKPTYLEGRRGIELAPAVVGYDDAVHTQRYGSARLVWMQDTLQQQRAVPEALQPFHVLPARAGIEQAAHLRGQRHDVGVAFLAVVGKGEPWAQGHAQQPGSMQGHVQDVSHT
jgi:hypothetical protein